MTKEENIRYFSKLLYETNKLYFWVYDSNLQLLETTYPAEDYQGFDSLFQIQAAPLISWEEDCCLPLNVYSFFNVEWLLDFEREDNQIKKIYVLGPTFTGENSYNALVKRMDERNLSIKVRAAVAKTLSSLPIIADNILNNYIIQLHYLITGDIIKDNILMLSRSSDLKYENPSKTASHHNGIWASEQTFLRLFKEGNPDFAKAIANSTLLSSGVKHDGKDTLRVAKNNAFVLLTLLSRASIEGGVSPDVAYDLNDFFAQRIEDADSIASNTQVCKELMQTYFNKVCDAKKASGVSSIVKNSCDYITTHITEKITLSDLAERSGYSEYYFSRKFKQEMGLSITEYIMQQKIERAKELLSTTNQSILDISLKLSFNSRSYFSDSFQKLVGISPGEYRKQNLKL